MLVWVSMDAKPVNRALPSQASPHLRLSRLRWFLPLIALSICGLFTVLQLRTAADWQAALRQQRAHFCTDQDPVLQVITTHTPTWLEHFRTASSLIPFTTPTGDPYTAGPLPGSASGFIVPTVFDPPHSYYGERGYLVTLGDPAQFGPDYTYTPFADQLYCFQRLAPHPIPAS
jgi:hypothetical protein